ncbi:MAG: alcohol dehydrogenase catalytic domain-containing protein [bacterium]|nr:alcohol dehydrogenase catalytic domain-containing protein [bacterium]
MPATIQARAAIADASGGFVFEEVDVDPPRAGEVLVEMRASGVCHTDWDWVRITDDAHVIGHEGAGVVALVGEGVERVARGDALVPNWAIPCGTCSWCERGAESICESKPLVPHECTRWRGQGIRRNFELGTMSTHAIVREEAVIAIPTGC